VVGLAKRVSAIEDRLSAVEGELSRLCIFIRDLRFISRLLKELHQHPEYGCLLLKEGGCPYDNPSELGCALCPFHVPPWLPPIVMKEIEKQKAKRR